MSNSFIESLLLASKRHGVPCVVIGGGGGDDWDDEGEDGYIQPPVVTEPVSPEQENAELAQLRSQVQSLTSQLQTQEQVAVVAGSNGNGQVAAGDHGDQEAHPIDSLGFEDEALVRKLMRLGYDSVGKLREAFGDARLADAKIKKDWLIEVGMRLAGAGPASSPAVVGSVPVSVGEAVQTGDVPGDHVDRPWMERLSIARNKQKNLDELRESLAEKRKEVEAYTAKKLPVPEELDQEDLAIDDDINIVSAQLVAMRWCMGLNPDPAVGLDEALALANLRPDGVPFPRVMPTA